MPCRSDYMEPTPGERAESAEVRQLFENIGNKACHYSDILRECLLGEIPLAEALPYVNHDLDGEYLRAVPKLEGLYVSVDEKTRCKTNELVQGYTDTNELLINGGPDNLSNQQLHDIRQKQRGHRQEDLDRLMRHFASVNDKVRLRKVLEADAGKLLKPQLGFDPDEY